MEKGSPHSLPLMESGKVSLQPGERRLLLPAVIFCVLLRDEFWLFLPPPTVGESSFQKQTPSLQTPTKLPEQIDVLPDGLGRSSASRRENYQQSQI